MVEEFFWNLISTALGVVIGGFITIKVSNITNTVLIRKQYTLEILQKIKGLLREWSEHILLDAASFFKCKEILEYKPITRCEKLQSLISYFDTNMSLLSEFKFTFKELRNQEIRMQLQAEDLKKELINLSEKYNSKDPTELYGYEEVSIAMEKYAKVSLQLHEDVEKLIVKIDIYVSEKILK